MPLRFTFRNNDPPHYLLNANSADAQAIGERLMEITEENSGRLRPDDVVEDARDPRSPMHPHFEWDNTVAADKYRLNQAREIIRIIVREDDEGEDDQPRRAFINVNSGDDGRSYRTVDEVMQSHDLQVAVMAQALRDLQSWQHRYQELSDICGLVATASSRLSAQIRRRQRRSAQPPPPPPPQQPRQQRRGRQATTPPAVATRRRPPRRPPSPETRV
jgi:hypothetical protein